MNRAYNSIFLFLLCVSFTAQVPDTDIWLFDLSTKKDKSVVPENPRNISNRKGYDNQPSFSADGKQIYYASMQGTQTDIYCYDIRKKKQTPVSKSSESEYSPVLWPGGPYLSAVVVEKDSAQKIHLVDPQTGATHKVLPYDSVGYCSFLNADTLVIYKLTQPHSLRVIYGDEKEHWICDSPARSFPATSRHAFVYGIKDSTSTTFFRYDLFLHKAIELTQLNSVCEDFTYHETYGLVRAEGAQLYRYNEVKKQWSVLFDLRFSGIKKISRFRFSPENKRLVVVDNL